MGVAGRLADYGPWSHHMLWNNALTTVHERFSSVVLLHSCPRDIFRVEGSSWMHTISEWLYWRVLCQKSLFIQTKNPGIRDLFFAVEKGLEEYESVMTPFGVWTSTVVHEFNRLSWQCASFGRSNTSFGCTHIDGITCRHVNCFKVRSIEKWQAFSGLWMHSTKQGIERFAGSDSRFAPSAWGWDKIVVSLQPCPCIWDRSGIQEEQYSAYYIICMAKYSTPRKHFRHWQYPLPS